MKEALGQQEETLGKATRLVQRREEGLAVLNAALAFGAALPSCGINAQ